MTGANPVAPEEIIDAYKAAAEHAKGHLFASMLKVSHADGWFTVRDLEGAESRYRKKEIMAATRNLLQEPEFTAVSVPELAAAAVIERGPEKPFIPRPRKEENVHSTEQIAEPFRREEATHNIKPAAEPSREQVIAFPGPTQECKRAVEDKSYFRNLWRIFLIVATFFGLVIAFFLLKRR